MWYVDQNVWFCFDQGGDRGCTSHFLVMLAVTRATGSVRRADFSGTSTGSFGGNEATRVSSFFFPGACLKAPPEEAARRRGIISSRTRRGGRRKGGLLLDLSEGVFHQCPSSANGTYVVGSSGTPDGLCLLPNQGNISHGSCSQSPDDFIILKRVGALGPRSHHCSLPQVEG